MLHLKKFTVLSGKVSSLLEVLRFRICFDQQLRLKCERMEALMPLIGYRGLEPVEQTGRTAKRSKSV